MRRCRQEARRPAAEGQKQPLPRPLQPACLHTPVVSHEAETADPVRVAQEQLDRGPAGPGRHEKQDIQVRRLSQDRAKGEEHVVPERREQEGTIASRE